MVKTQYCRFRRYHRMLHQLLADRFVEFFTKKIEKTLNFLYFTEFPTHHPDSPPPMFASFSTVTEDQVTNIILDSPTKSCSLDTWPTFLVLEYLEILITPITSIINAFPEQGKRPNFFKQADVTPILKKSSLDKEIFKNYRPVSNINFISKILERVVAAQLQTHLDKAGLMTAFQSAYRKHHSTESALLNIYNDILLNMAKGSVTALTLLDLSTALDTIDHTILLDRLNGYYGISELALGWFKSYLSGRTHSGQGRQHTLKSCCPPIWGPPGLRPWSNSFFALHQPNQLHLSISQWH